MASDTSDRLARRHFSFMSSHHRLLCTLYRNPVASSFWSVCLLVIRDRNFMFVMRTELMKYFQMTQTPWYWDHFHYLFTTNSHVGAGDICVSQYHKCNLLNQVLHILSTFSVSKLIEIVIVWVYYTIAFGFSSFFNFLNHFVWLRTTDEGSVPEMRIWSILLIDSDFKWCIHLSRSLFLYFNYLVGVTAGGPESPRGHM